MPRVKKDQTNVQIDASDKRKHRSINLQSTPKAESKPYNPAKLRDLLYNFPKNKKGQIDGTDLLYRGRYGRSLNLDLIERGLRDADYGRMQLITDINRETIDTDPHLSSVVHKRFGAIATLPWEVRPADGVGIDKEKAKFYADVVRLQLRRLPSFGARLNQLAWGLFDGRAALENKWGEVNQFNSSLMPVHQKYGRVRWQIVDLGWIHPRRLSFSSNRDLVITDEITVYSNNQKETPLHLEAYKFIYWTPQLFGDYPEREGIARRALYWSFFKRFAARERMVLVELFGKPWRWLEVDENSSADSDDLQAADEILQNTGDQTSFRWPRGTRFKIAQPGDGAGSVHKEIIKESDSQISKLVLGQVATTDAQNFGLNSSQANVMQDEQFMVLSLDSGLLSEVIETYLTDAIIELNFGPLEVGHAPTFRLRADAPLDRIKEITRLDKALNAGLEIALSEAYELSGFRIPSADEAVIKLETPPVHPMAIQPSPERPVIVYPAGSRLPDRQILPTAEIDRENLVSPDDLIKGIEGSEDQSLELQTSTEKDNSDNESEFTRLTRGLINCHPSDLDIIRNILLTERSIGSVLCSSEVDPDDIDLEVRKAPQPPDKLVGSLESIIRRGVNEGARESQKMIDTYLEAIRGKTNPESIIRALDNANEDMNLYGFSRAIEKKIVHGVMSGILASQYELETDELLPVAKLTSRNSKLLLADISEDFADQSLVDALSWFKRLKIVSRTTFDNLTAAAKRRAFTVANAVSNRMIGKIKDELEDTVKRGGQLRDFQKFAKERLESAGFTPANPSHVETIYRTNVLNSYNSGRHTHSTQPTVLKMRPYWQIRTVNDGPPRQRKTHQAVHLWVLKASDPVWKDIYPPFGFNCRCRVITLSEKNLQDRGLKIRTGGEIHGLPDYKFVCGTKSLL